MSNSFKIRPTHFSCGDENVCRRDSPFFWLRAYGFLHHKQQTFSCVLYAHSQFLCSSVKFELRQPVQPHTFNAQFLVFDETLVQPEFAVVNCSHVGMSVFHLPCCNAQPDSFAVMNCCVVALSLFSSDCLTWSADSLYWMQWHMK